MTEYIFTFGGGHVHPLSGASLARSFVRLEADSVGAARQIMFALFGAKWSHQYESEADAGVERWGLRELPVLDVARERVRAGKLVEHLLHDQHFTCNVTRETHPEIQATGVTVHVLIGGFPACGFSREIPRDWPPGHKWHEHPSGATCAACLDVVNYHRGESEL